MFAWKACAQAGTEIARPATTTPSASATAAWTLGRTDLGREELSVGKGEEFGRMLILLDDFYLKSIAEVMGGGCVQGDNVPFGEA